MYWLKKGKEAGAALTEYALLVMVLMIATTGIFTLPVQNDLKLPNTAFVVDPVPETQTLPEKLKAKFKVAAKFLGGGSVSTEAITKQCEANPLCRVSGK